MRRLLLALLASTPAAAGASAGEAPVALTVRADAIEVQGGVVQGHGQVRVDRPGEVLLAERFTLELESGRLVVEEGSWQRAEGRVRFARAVLDLPAEGEAGVEAVLDEARLDAPGLVVEGDRLQWLPDGRIEGLGLRLTTCGCDRPPWEVQARRATVLPGEEVRFAGGLVRVLGVPVLPVPGGRLALAERKSGLLPPRLGTGRDGLVVGVPAWLALGEQAELALEPELRTDRGARLLAEGAWQHVGGRGRARLAGGYDWEEATARGGLAVEQGAATGPWRLGLDARLEGDRAYLADYGDGFLARSLPWGESLAVAGWGPLRLEHDGVQALGEAAAQGQRPLGVVAERGGVRLGPVAVDALGRLDLVGEGTDPWAVAGPLQRRVEGRLGAEVGRELGVVRVEGRTEAWAVAYGDEAPWLVGAAEARGWLPTWAALPGARLVGEWGVVGAVAEAAGEVAPRLPGVAPPPAWSVGPAVTGRLLTAAGVPVSGAGSLAWTADGLEPAGWLRADRGAWSARLLGQADVQELRLGYDDGVLALGLAGVHSDPLLQTALDGAWSLPGPLAGLRPGYAALLDVPGGAALFHGPRLAWTSRCGCLSMSSTLTWSRDRERPDFGFQLSLD